MSSIPHLRAFYREGHLKEALHILLTMHYPPIDSSTYLQLLQTCIVTNALSESKLIHSFISDRGFAFATSTFFQNKLINVYAKCGSLVDARKVFDHMIDRDVFSWNMVIAAYRRHGFPREALTLFHQMQLTGIQPDEFTFTSILPACAHMRSLEQGIEIHQRTIECGLLSDNVIGNALMDMYAKCGSVQRARELFDKMPQRNVVSWNAMIAGYAKTGVLEEASRLFTEMPRRDVFSWTAMIAGYAQNGILDEALTFFKEMPHRNVVSWTAMIAGYAQNGFVEKALEIFQQMQLAYVNPNSATVASVLPACAKMGALEQGMELHQRIIESGFLSDAVVANALIDMYAKCGSIHKARKLFDNIHHPNVVSWTVMIAGYAMHGHGKDAIKLFELMNYSGTNPNHVSFVCVLFACSHAGLLDEGCKKFNHMNISYSIKPTMDHYVCMVDLLGRAGYLQEALIFIIKMPIKSDAVLWMCLLGACKSHKNIGLGEFAAAVIFELDPKDAAPYALLSDMYAELGRLGDVQNMWKVMKDRGIKKILGCSWIEVHKTVHAFSVGNRSHPQAQEIYAKLDKLSWEMKAAGYIPELRPVLTEVEEEEKELLLSHHSEKLAIAFGLLSTSTGTTIRVVKNLRVCVDCHTATKFISKVVAREIVVRDANRFHHFKHGQCSCGDYW